MLKQKNIRSNPEPSIFGDLAAPQTPKDNAPENQNEFDEGKAKEKVSEIFNTGRIM